MATYTPTFNIINYIDFFNLDNLFGADIFNVNLKVSDIYIRDNINELTQTCTLTIPRTRDISYQPEEKLIRYDDEGVKEIKLGDQLEVNFWYKESLPQIDKANLMAFAKDFFDEDWKFTFSGQVSNITVTEKQIIVTLEDNMYLLKNISLKYSGDDTTKISDILTAINTEVDKQWLIKPLDTLTQITAFKEYDFNIGTFNMDSYLSGYEILEKIKEKYDDSYYIFFRNGILHYGIKYYQFIDGYDKVMSGFNRHKIFTPNANEYMDIREHEDGLITAEIDFKYETFRVNNVVITVVSVRPNKEAEYAKAELVNSKLVITSGLSKDLKTKSSDNNIQINMPNLSLDEMKNMVENKWSDLVGSNSQKTNGVITVFGTRKVAPGDIIDFKTQLSYNEEPKEESYFIDSVVYILSADGIKQEITLGSLVYNGYDPDN